MFHLMVKNSLEIRLFCKPSVLRVDVETPLIIFLAFALPVYFHYISVKRRVIRSTQFEPVKKKYFNELNKFSHISPHILLPFAVRFYKLSRSGFARRLSRLN